MTQKSNESVQHYSKEELVLKEAVSGAQMFGVALEKTMLTYFEIEPHSTFEKHNHESEQITMVLEGELYFETEGKIICVKQGEVVAIPSNIMHSVCTKEQAVKAVDAWSPVMEKYKER